VCRVVQVHCVAHDVETRRFGAVVLETSPRFWYLVAINCGVQADSSASLSVIGRFLNPGGSWEREVSRHEQALGPLAVFGIVASVLNLLATITLAVRGKRSQRTGTLIHKTYAALF